MKHNIPYHAQCQADFTTSKFITFLKHDVSNEVLQECPYIFEAGHWMMCKCPVRYYLNKEYGV
jgi:hypothetical protein